MSQSAICQSCQGISCIEQAQSRALRLCSCHMDQSELQLYHNVIGQNDETGKLSSTSLKILYAMVVALGTIDLEFPNNLAVNVILIFFN